MAITVKRYEGETDDDAMARELINPSLLSALTIDNFTQKGLETDTGALIEQLNKLCKDDNFNAENMLIAQAHTGSAKQVML